MVARGSANWTVRIVTLAVWLLAAGSAVFWGLRLSSSGTSNAAPPPALRLPGPGDPAAVARLLGHTAVASTTAPGPVATAPPLASRFTLLGVVAGRSEQGAALIAVEGRPVRPYRVGTPVGEGLVLKSVQARKAVLAASLDGPAVVTLELQPTQAQR